MDSASYATLSRQVGLWREMSIVANNIANSATNGYRQEGLVFSEYIKADPGGRSLSMGNGNIQNTSFTQGALTETGGTFDFAIEGEGFFLVETPMGERLTRAGSFSPNAEGDLVTHDGLRVLDIGGAPVFVPPDAGNIAVAADGTISADGRLLGQLGVVRPLDPGGMTREDGVMFVAEAGFEPDDTSRVLQGFVENSNVDAVTALARMIEVQRAYELGQSFLDSEDQRVRSALSSLSK
ncbi:flagellar hook-basal body complex protein [Aliishimia ponticola]|uniref:Flagellar basal-body rod protein FlgF n=1 Tax=Aliishimia ponticola TaxID=2499833 RepID=A0A4V3XK25_9RHOB|nr:flagellar hook-basal body complex protein [Aliishimia ponticola]THH35313.1 flagellar hook-basal body complex protein [Aliishimia ponticola]